MKTLARAFLNLPSFPTATEKERTRITSWLLRLPWCRARWVALKDHRRRRCRADESLRAKDPSSPWRIETMRRQSRRIPERKLSLSRHRRPRLRSSDVVEVVVTPWIEWSKLAFRYVYCFLKRSRRKSADDDSKSRRIIENLSRPFYAHESLVLKNSVFDRSFKSSVLYRKMLGFRVSARFDERDRENQNTFLFVEFESPRSGKKLKKTYNSPLFYASFSFTTIKLTVLTGRWLLGCKYWCSSVGERTNRQRVSNRWTSYERFGLRWKPGTRGSCRERKSR